MLHCAPLPILARAVHSSDTNWSPAELIHLALVNDSNLEGVPHRCNLSNQLLEVVRFLAHDDAPIEVTPSGAGHTIGEIFARKVSHERQADPGVRADREMDSAS